MTISFGSCPVSARRAQRRLSECTQELGWSMGSALPADTEASDTPDSVYREQFPRSSSFGCGCAWGIRIAGLEMLTSGRSAFPDLDPLETCNGDLALFQTIVPETCVRFARQESGGT